MRRPNVSPDVKSKVRPADGAVNICFVELVHVHIDRNTLAFSLRNTLLVRDLT